MKRKIFRVEQKTGKMPDVAWKIVFEREIELSSLADGLPYVGTDSVLQSLRFLYSGEQYRITLICD